MSETPQHLYQWSDVRSGRRIHLSELHHVQRFSLGCGSEETSVGQHKQCHTSPLECVRTPCCPSTPRWRCTRPVYSALYCMTEESWESPGRTTYQTKMSMPKQALQAFLHYGHVNQIENGWIPKDLLSGVVATGARCVWRPTLCSNNICEQNMKVYNIPLEDRGSHGSRPHGMAAWNQSSH